MPVFQAPIPAQSVRTVTTNTTLTLVDDTILVDATSGNITLTLPLASSVPTKTFSLKKIDSTENTVTVQTQDSDQILNTVLSSSLVITSQGTAFNLQTDGTTYYLF